MALDVRVKPDHWLPTGEVMVDEKGEKPLVVWKGIPGEIATVRVVHRGHNRAFGLWKWAKEPDPHRVEPPCDRYDVCGGCPLMHLDAAGQEQARRDMVAQALGDLPVEIGAFHPSPDGLSDFRRVIKVGMGYSDRKHIRIGAWGRRNRHIVPIPNCVVAEDGLNQTMKALAYHVIDLNLRPYEPETDHGVLRSAVMRTSRTTGEILITLVAGRRVRDLRELAERIAQQVSNVTGIWLHLNTDPGNAIFHRDEDGRVGIRPLIGKDHIEEEIDGITYKIGPTDFFQTNPAVAAVIYKRVIERLELSNGDPVVDLYCGVGGLALQAARITGWAMGVEEGAAAVARAREAARVNRIDAEFTSGRVVEVLPEVGKRLQASPIVTVNPARRGLEDGVVEAILDLKPRKIAYVSCNPRALARDLEAFIEAGFEAGEVELFDMFPNTAHVECLVTLTAPEEDVQEGRAPRRRVVRR